MRWLECHQGQTMLYRKELDIPVISVTMAYCDCSFCLVFPYTKFLMILNDVVYKWSLVVSLPPTCCTVNWRTPTQRVSCHIEWCIRECTWMITMPSRADNAVQWRTMDISVIHVTMTYCDYSFCLVFSYTKFLMSIIMLFANDHLFLFPPTCCAVDWAYSYSAGKLSFWMMY